jgi:hypothetical protein
MNKKKFPILGHELFYSVIFKYVFKHLMDDTISGVIRIRLLGEGGGGAQWTVYENQTTKKI